MSNNKKQNEMKAIEKIKGDRITKGMQILVEEVYNSENNINCYGFPQRAITPKKNKKTEILTILNTKVLKSFNTGNGRTYMACIILLETLEYGNVCINSTERYILA
jgi:hypothetical protein